MSKSLEALETSSLAERYHFLGWKEEALREEKKALKLVIEVHGKKSPVTAAKMMILADRYEAVENTRKADYWYKEAAIVLGELSRRK